MFAGAISHMLFKSISWVFATELDHKLISGCLGKDASSGDLRDVTVSLDNGCDGDR